MFKNSSQYNEINTLPKTITREILKKYNRFIKYGKQDLILDVGSGSGNVVSEVLLPFIPHSNFHLVGIDVSTPMIEFATHRNKDPRLSFRVLDMTVKNEENLKRVFTDTELNPGFDKVFSFACLMWTSDHEQCLENIFKLLRSGGQTLVWFMGYNDLSIVYKEILEMKKWMAYLKDEPILKYAYHDSMDVKSDCYNLMKKIGFQDIISDCERKHFKDYVDIYDFKVHECMDPYVNKLPQHLQREYLDDVITVIDRHIKNDGLTFDLIILLASKP
uniref:Methyltransferase type 12 domain-containing protein n=2 Tax=Clastoptera arizonana TaxID=38151 RepID=A0A1B6E175_9HEMI